RRADQARRRRPRTGDRGAHRRAAAVVARPPRQGVHRMKTITAGLVLVLVAGCGQATERAYEPRAEPAPAATSAAAEPATTRSASGRPATARVGDLRVRIDWPEEDSALLRVFP